MINANKMPANAEYKLVPAILDAIAKVADDFGLSKRDKRYLQTRMIQRALRLKFMDTFPSKVDAAEKRRIYKLVLGSGEKGISHGMLLMKTFKIAPETCEELISELIEAGAIVQVYVPGMRTKIMYYPPALAPSM